ncbi:MAG: TolC family protein [Opitutaceae bacterium]|nr:TolC family protein [Opitutaceae bacterium]
MKIFPLNQPTISGSRSAFDTRQSALRRACLPALALVCALGGRAETLTLDDAVRLALENNRSIKVDAYSRAIARANLLSAYGQFDPALNFNRSYNEVYTASSAAPENGFLPPATLIQGDYYSLSLGGVLPWGTIYSLGGTAQNQRGTYNGFASNYLTTGGLTITQPLLRGFGPGANLLGVRIARANRALSDWQYRQTVIDTITSVVIAYSDLAAAHENLRIARSSRDLAATLLAENEKRFKVGSMSANDVASARARTAFREEAILFAERAVRDTDRQLRLLLGEGTFPADGPLLAIAPPPQPEEAAHPAEDLQKAYGLRPDYQQARLSLEKSRYHETAARNQLLPQVDFVGNYGYTGFDQSFAASRRMVAGQDNRAYSAGVVVSVPLTFAKGRGAARAARLERYQAEADLKRQEENIALAVATAAGQIETTQKRVAATQTALKLTQQTLDDEIKKLRAGASSTFNVLYIQDQLAAAEYGYYQARADERRAAAAYDHEIGTALEAHHIVLGDK